MSRPTRLTPPLVTVPADPEKFHWASQQSVRWLLALVFVVVIYAIPFINASNYLIQILTTALIYVMLAMGLNVVVGFAGLLDLGYIAFFAVGAYTSGIFTTRLGWPMWAAIGPVIISCIIAGIVIGGPTLRLRSDYLAIVTLGFGEIIRLTANNLIDVTGGPSGIFGIPTWRFGDWSFTNGLNLFGIHFEQRILFYYFVATIVLVVGVVGLSRLSRGRLGRAWQAVRDDEDAAEAMGINTYLAKITAYIIGAVWAGLAGQLMASHISTVSPTQFQFLYSALVLCAVVIGGLGSMPGAIIGAFIISLMPEVLRDVWENRYLLFGILLLVVMLFRPQGLWPATAALPWSRDPHRGGHLSAPQLRQETRRGLVLTGVGLVLVIAGLVLDQANLAGPDVLHLVIRLSWMVGLVLVLFGLVGLIRALVDQRQLRHADPDFVTPSSPLSAETPPLSATTVSTTPPSPATPTETVSSLPLSSSDSSETLASSDPDGPLDSSPALTPDRALDLTNTEDSEGASTPSNTEGSDSITAEPTALSTISAMPEPKTDAAPKNPATSATATPLLQVTDLTVKFGGVTAVDQLSMTVYPGEIISVIGPNGAGKTSAFNSISGFYRPNAGSITFQGRSIRRARPSTITQLGLARTFQNLRLFRDMTVLDNVKTAAHSRTVQHWFDAFLHTPRYRRSERTIEQRALAWLDFVGFQGDSQLYVVQLPYGEQRRVEIARALNAEPSLLLLDEPAAGLNHREKAALIDLIERIQALGVAIVLIEHDMGLVMRVSERIIVLNYGHQIAAGSPADIRQNQLVIE
ncbi:MAG: ATP-binding cassette domain-containing protein, partial [Propionibacteriaceae bacterium]|nr:ATP-binding cassette domain-containing protein [Propionibacteriaceae bacterium]